MPKKIEPPLIARLNPSKRLKQIIVAAHVLAFVAGLSNALPAVYKIVLLSGIAGNLYFAFKRLNTPQPTIQYTDAAGWEITNGNECESVSILGSTVLTIYAIWLHVKRQDSHTLFGKRKRAILIMSDALDEYEFRRLIVKLKTTSTE